MALRAVRRLTPLLAHHVAHTPAESIARHAPMYPMMQTVLALAYLVHPSSLPGPSKRPDPVQALQALVHDAARTQDDARTAELLTALVDLVPSGLCSPTDPTLLHTLKRGLFALAQATRTARADVPFAAFAIAAVYDRCQTHTVVLPHGCMASIVASLARILPSETLREALALLTTDFLAQPRGDESGLCALLSAYGRAGVPERGEALLAAYAGEAPTARAWAQQHKRCPRAATYLAHVRARPPGRLPREVPLGAWCRHAAVWNALIRARVLNGDLAAAQRWLERYRLALHLDAGRRPARTASPYLTLMHACSSAPGIRAYFAQASASTRHMLRRTACARDAPFRTAAIYDLLRAVHADRVVPGVAMLNFLTSFEAGRGRVAHAAAFARQALALPWAPHQFRVHKTTCAPLFALYAAAARAAQVHEAAAGATYDAMQPLCVAPLAGPDADGDQALAPLLRTLRTPRALLLTCLAVWDTSGTPLPAKHGTQLLHSALDALLACRDYPAALYALHALTDRGVHCDAYTHACIWAHLPPSGSVHEAMVRAVQAQMAAMRALPPSTRLPRWAEELRALPCTQAGVAEAEARVHRPRVGHGFYERV